MRKAAVRKTKKESEKRNVNSEVLHDIIKKVKESHETADKKMSEIVAMCAPKEVRIK